MVSPRLRFAPWLLPVLLSWSLDLPAAGQPPADHTAKAHHPPKKQKGKASYYSHKFTGKRMADGTPMDPNANVAASKTLPLGTKAEVKNLETGKSTEVEIRDRGPYVKDRIIDLSPKAAEKLDMKKEGVAPVEVTPTEVPPPKTLEGGR